MAINTVDTVCRVYFSGNNSKMARETGINRGTLSRLRLNDSEGLTHTMRFVNDKWQLLTLVTSSKKAA